jgi:hypothetical protein
MKILIPASLVYLFSLSTVLGLLSRYEYVVANY